MLSRLGVFLMVTISITLMLGIGLTKPAIAITGQPPQAQLTSLADNFNGNTINSSLWNTAQVGTGPSVNAVNQRIEVSFPTNSTNDPSLGIFGAGLSSRCIVEGDFDAQVDFRLANWTFSNGVRVGLASTPEAFFASAFSNTNPPFAVERISFGNPINDFPGLPREAYLTHFLDGVQGVTPTSDLSGSLRLTRTGGLETGYYMSSGNWVMIHTGPSITQEIHLNIVAWSHDYAFEHRFVKVAFDNFTLNRGTTSCPAIALNPSSGPLGTKVVVQGSGFPTSSFGPSTVVVSFDDMLSGFTTASNGTFSFTFNVPDAQPGAHFVKALDEFTGTSAVADFQVTQVNTLALGVDVGTLYFPGDTVSIYTLAILSGTPLNSSTLQLHLILMKPDGSNLTLASRSSGSGLFKATYAIPSAGPLGTYAIVANAHVANVQDATSLTTFEVKLTWLSAQGPAITIATATAALTGMVALTALVWRKGLLRGKGTPGNRQ
jgi:hypothetical protein